MHSPGRKGSEKTLLRALREDQRGNTLAMLAVALIPLLGIVGSAVDTARLYAVKVRLQQACDAGVLAGRKMMSSSASSALNAEAVTESQNFFRNNFRQGTFGTNTAVFTPSKTSDNQVAGAATVVVPMTLTSMMGFGDSNIAVTCEARFDVADLDIMFVLDTTGSMAYAATDTNTSGQTQSSYTRSDGTTGYYTAEKTNARIKALRTAVLNFYDTLLAAADSTTKIRYGFVPYTSTVNVGKIIPNDYLVRTNHTYSSRRPVESNSGNQTSETSYVNETPCKALAGRTPATGYDSSGQAVVRTFRDWRSSDKRCRIYAQKVQLSWRYENVNTDVSGYVAGGWVPDPSKVDGSQSKWQGCIEERSTTPSTSFSQSSLPNDLNPDLMPTDYATRWRPMWPDIIYKRNGELGGIDVSFADASFFSVYENIGRAGLVQLGHVSCGKEAKRLGVMSRTEVSNYVNHPDFRPIGGTYHDVGMIWGTRFLSPTGPFANDTAAWPGRREPTRHLIFMTDGEMAPTADIYGLYGVERTDRRVTGTDLNSQTTRHTTRFSAECEAAKNRQITVWVITFGSTMTSELQACATTAGHAIPASNDAQLNSAFQTIAARVAMLRLSR